MNVKKVFVTLITVVVCVMLGAFVLNKVFPNTVTQVSSAIEGMIYNATKISVDLNGDGKNGKTNKSGNYSAGQTTKGSDTDGAKVEGFK